MLSGQRFLCNFNLRNDEKTDWLCRLVQPSHNDEDTPDPPTKVNRSTSISELPEDDNDAPLTDISELGALVSAKAMAPEEAVSYLQFLLTPVVFFPLP